MAFGTSIQWTDSTFNCWRGCTKVSAGCANCYAEALSGRNPAVLGEWGLNGTRVLASHAAWHDPEVWNRKAARAPRRHRVFCASLGDVFEDWPGQMVDHKGNKLLLSGIHPRFACGSPAWPGAEPYGLNHARGCLWDLIRKTPRLMWLLLTKRPGNIARMLPPEEWPNVMLGVSVENQDNVWRVDCLLEESIAHAGVAGLFVSAEPLLGPIDFGSTLGSKYGAINWVIVGGESGGGAREMCVDWARYILSQCQRAGAAPFIKQLGKNPLVVSSDGSRLTPLELLHSKGGLVTEFPLDLQVREFPPCSL